MENPIENLERALSRLPGLGRRSAERAALALVRDPEVLLEPLIHALTVAREEVVCCPVCGGFTVRGESPCSVCQDSLRDPSLLCVVEEPSDIVSMERAHVFKGQYHALHGKVSASRGTGPNDLRLGELTARLYSGTIKEVILATGTDLDGDATAEFITSLIKQTAPAVRITRLAYGLPVDSGIAYSDPITLKRALAGRT